MQDVDVVILYEKAVRELDVACAIKAIAGRRHGLRVEIVQQNYSYPRAFREFRPRIVVLPFCYQERSNNFYFLRWRGATFFNLTWEQLFYGGNRQSKTPRGEFAVNHVIHHAWSETYAQFLKAHGIPEKLIWVNGNPAYMLYEKPYRNYFSQRNDLAARHGLDPNKKWIFFPENYNWAFYSERTLQQFIADGQSADDVKAMRDFCQLSLEQVMPWMCDVARRSDIEFIVRPRPATPADEFKAAVQRVLPIIPERMHITQAESVREWILASDLVLSSHSTSLIEASLAGKPAYIVAPYPIPKPLQVEWHALISHITSRDQFTDVCLNDRMTNDSHRLGAWARSAALAHGDPILNIANYLAELRHGTIAHPPIHSRQSVTLPGRVNLPAWLLFEWRKRRIGWEIRRAGPPMNVAPDTQVDVASEREIGPRTEKWDKVLAGYLEAHQ